MQPHDKLHANVWNTLDGTERAIALPPSIDLTQADPLLQSLQSQLAQHATLCINGSAVEHVSTACLQVLTAAAVTARASGGMFTIIAPSRALSDAATDLGLSEALGLGEE